MIPTLWTQLTSGRIMPLRREAVAKDKLGFV